MAESVVLQEALVASEERYRRLLEYSPVAIAIHVNAVIVYVNAAAVRLIGAISAAELLGRSFLDFFHPDYRDFVLGRGRQVQIERRITELAPKKFIRVDRREIDVEVITVPTIFEGNAAAQVIIRDVTDQRLAEAALRHEEEQLQVLVQASGVVLGSLDLEQVLSRILILAKEQITADAYAVWRYQASSAEWRAIASDGLSQAFQDAAICAMNHSASMPDTALMVENLDQERLLARHREIHRLPGTQALMVIPLRIHGTVTGTLAFYYHQPHRFTYNETHLATALANLAGAAIGTAELYQKQARLRDEAEAAVQARGQFLALVAHDLKNPLTVMKARTQFLQRRLRRSDPQLDPVQVGEGLAQIAAGIAHMLVVINDLVDVARVQAGQPIEFTQQPTDLVALVNQVAQNFQQMGEHYQIVVEAHVAELIGNWNPSRLERVLENLLTNAIKYSPQGGPITIGVDRAAADNDLAAILTVRDYGIGIPPGDLPHIFEPFRRGHNVEGHPEGVGIGLAGVQQIISQHCGTIEVVSEENRGSTFTIRLPLQLTETTTD